MTKPIKLTETSIGIISDDGINCRVRFSSLEGYEVIWTSKQARQLQQQILESQKIIDAIKKQNESDMTETWYAIDEYSNMINTLVKDATGKEIKDL